LPGAVWAEKEGSFTNTERRVQWSSKAVDPPGSALSDLDIVCRVARSLGLDFDYHDAASVLAEINRTVPQYAGITRERLENGGLIWPCPTADHPGTPILHSSGFKLADGRAAIVAVHHNAGSMTRRSPSLISREPELYVEMNAADAAKLKVADGKIVIVATPRGETEASARITEGVKRGVVFMPFHFPGTNMLTQEITDPEARIPEFKVSACRISRRD
jgi:formate dehydrogenase major subunit